MKKKIRKEMDIIIINLTNFQKKTKLILKNKTILYIIQNKIIIRNKKLTTQIKK